MYQGLVISPFIHKLIHSFPIQFVFISVQKRKILHLIGLHSWELSGETYLSSILIHPRQLRLVLIGTAAMVPLSLSLSVWCRGMSVLLTVQFSVFPDYIREESQGNLQIPLQRFLFVCVCVCLFVICNSVIFVNFLVSYLGYRGEENFVYWTQKRDFFPERFSFTLIKVLYLILRLLETRQSKCTINYDNWWKVLLWEEQ